MLEATQHYKKNLAESQTFLIAFLASFMLCKLATNQYLMGLINIRKLFTVHCLNSELYTNTAASYVFQNKSGAVI